MQDLRVIGVENGALVVVSDEGERYRVPIDDVMQSKLRQSLPAPGSDRKVSPREIQAHIRGGMSAGDVAALTGVAVEYIERFEGPVLAEREFVIESALAVPVHTALETDPNSGSTFGSVIEDRLDGINAENSRWASWKEAEVGWVVKLSFVAEDVEHDARWQFDPKKISLAPLNSEAVTLSQQGEATGVLIPRLRAVGTTERNADSSRFDSGAFLLDDSEPAPRSASAYPLHTQSESVDDASIEKNPTADLLEALRRRRGERESASYAEEESIAHVAADHPAVNGIRLVDVPLDGFMDDDESGQRQTSPQPGVQAKQVRKGRATMPSWDDIVFGARPDDDLA
jgi:hypothetical protein